jgi:cytochrome c biogenesis protein CcdA
MRTLPCQGKGREFEPRLPLSRPVGIRCGPRVVCVKRRGNCGEVRLLPGPRWRWATRVVVALVTVAIASSLVAVAPIQLSTRLPSMANPLAVPALDGLTNGSPLTGIALALVLVLLVASVVVRFRRSRDVERSQLRWFAYAAGAAIGLLILAFLFPSGSADNLAWLAGIFGLIVLVPAAIGVQVRVQRLMATFGE